MYIAYNTTHIQYKDTYILYIMQTYMYVSSKNIYLNLPYNMNDHLTFKTIQKNKNEFDY